jgi:hypothetical protein
LRLGYCLAPVVVAATCAKAADLGGAVRKMTIAQWQPGYVDLARVAALLNRNEPGWGGSAGIVGSPQGQACRSGIEEALTAIRDCRATLVPTREHLS